MECLNFKNKIDFERRNVYTTNDITEQMREAKFNFAGTMNTLQWNFSNTSFYSKNLIKAVQPLLHPNGFQNWLQLKKFSHQSTMINIYSNLQKFYM